MSGSDFRLLDDDTQFMDKYPNGLSLVDLLPFYDSIAKNEPLKLEWVCPGKIDPNVQRETTKIRTETNDNPAPKVSESLTSIVKLKEFDFDESPNQPSIPSVPLGAAAQNANLPLRRLAGTSRHPPRQPRVASMDKILNDFFKTRKEPSSPAVVTEISTSSIAPSAVHCIPSSEISQVTNIFTETNNSSNNNSEQDKQEALVAELAKASVSPQVYNHPDNIPSDFTPHDNSNVRITSIDQEISASVVNICDERIMERHKLEGTDLYINNTNSSDYSAMNVSDIPFTSITVNNMSQSENETPH
ncbi:TM2 domain-containing protein 2, variant 3 [Schistosoma haematobium]|uniref:TM2 domain-containing protein 2, variant 3 n=2 Tax=Schistosoma TaxID=6181 RepID=A0A094ZT81_SCHHA|nr:TM2 domain-containing protein 2, variant 3 [Schistosoma haematobium]KAH9588223.1 TM2 domain-containing protein 2, variant 3 [Schistosoma haematobium]RTG86027.1 uncharacterized protein DC041_0010523 [Schistosoma bovis]